MPILTRSRRDETSLDDVTRAALGINGTQLTPPDFLRRSRDRARVTRDVASLGGEKKERRKEREKKGQLRPYICAVPETVPELKKET
jgi:hypothetical protein